jgi:ferredoxin-NADP reductase
MSRWVEGSVVRLKPWTDRLYSIQVTAEIAPFVAGQFTRLALEIDGEVVARPYSFLNAPSDPLHEFYFVTVPGGPLTSRLIRLAPGDPILIAPKAAGFFTLGELSDAGVLWLLSTGTAIGPFLSILAARSGDATPVSFWYMQYGPRMNSVTGSVSMPACSSTRNSCSTFPLSAAKRPDSPSGAGYRQRSSQVSWNSAPVWQLIPIRPR